MKLGSSITRHPTRFAPRQFSVSPFLSRKIRVERSLDRLMPRLRSVNCEGKVSEVERDLSSENGRANCSLDDLFTIGVDRFS